jgi:hypothetical protein
LAAPARYSYTVVFNASRGEISDLEHRGLCAMKLEVGEDVSESDSAGQERRNRALTQ